MVKRLLSHSNHIPRNLFLESYSKERAIFGMCGGTCLSFYQLGRLRQEDDRFEASLGYTVRSCLKKKKKKEREKEERREEEGMRRQKEGRKGKERTI
jgi:hypothetical protein